MSSAFKFDITPTGSGTELRLLTANELQPTGTWALSGHPGTDIIARWEIDGEALDGETFYLVADAAVSRLSFADSAQLGLPAMTALRAVVEGSGIMVSPDFTVSLRWTRASGQNVPGIKRTGAWLREADGWRRLPETLFNVAEAVDKHCSAKDQGDRLSAVAALTRALPDAALTGGAEALGLLGKVTILEAHSFSLDCAGEGDSLQIVPVLHGSSAKQDNEPILSPELQRTFGVEQFIRWPSARSVYSLPGGTYVTIAPPLRQALEVVRRTAEASPAERRAFLREPRGTLRAAVGEEADSSLIDNLVVETQAWSDRVTGLGLWQRRVIPWIVLPSNPWFEGAAGSAPQARGLMVGDIGVPLSQREAAILTQDVQEAIDTGKPEVVWQTEQGPRPIPANEETMRALQTLVARSEKPTPPARAVEALIIKPNESGQDVYAIVQARPSQPNIAPSCLATDLKDHQRAGLLWLQQNWKAGSPGVLLADDMGLGKTLQGLAFLAWLREGMQNGFITRRPFLIVAPTGLLFNWLEEHNKHLASPGLGTPLLAFGKGLADLRHGRERLDLALMRDADWVLTTYETLRDYDQDFGAVHFGAILIDEAQKVKTPGTRMTDAAKAMHADFRIAMTGTPVENRLSDLWCIVDGVAPGHLGDLRYFSRRFEGEPNANLMAELKASLDQRCGAIPPVLLRRLKEDQLPGLPSRTDLVTKAVMGGRQLAAYQAALDMGRGDRAAGRVLEALQRIRTVSLHPDADRVVDDKELMDGSARLRVAVQALDTIAERGERALLFVESLAFMAHLVGFLQRRFRLRHPPMTISGKVAGGIRQDRVNRFQEGPPGFDVMLLSPRAGGVGLTLTRANHVIHLTRWWNPAVEDQSTARVLRIGQERPVTVHLPLATLPDGRTSFDENLHALLGRKRRLMRDALFPAEADAQDLSHMLDDVIA